MRDPVTVVYIGGYGRSGSTLLDCILGEVPGVVNLGEVHYLWKRGVQDDQLCGCGTPLRECPFWQAVFEEAFGGFDAAPVEEMEEHRRRTDRVVRLPLLVGPVAAPGFVERVRRFAEIRGRLYRAAAQRAGADVVVDSSKIPSTPYLLLAAEGIDLVTVHLVRDSRGVAHSWQRKKRRPEVTGKEAYMPRGGPVTSSRKWAIHNAAMEPVAARSPRHLRIRYEDLARRPAETVAGILDLAGIDADLPIDDGTVAFTGNHTASGNPLRFKEGPIDVRLDDEWVRAMPASHWLVTTALTWPALRRYGYRISKGAPSRR